MRLAALRIMDFLAHTKEISRHIVRNRFHCQTFSLDLSLTFQSQSRLNNGEQHEKYLYNEIQPLWTLQDA